MYAYFVYLLMGDVHGDAQTLKHNLLFILNIYKLFGNLYFVEIKLGASVGNKSKFNDL